MDHKYLKKRGDNYLISYEKSVSGKRYRSRLSLGTKDKSEAIRLYEKHIQRVIAEAHQGDEYQREQAKFTGAVSVDKLIEIFSERKKAHLSEKSVARDRSHFAKLKEFLDPKIKENVRLMTNKHCQEWVNRRMSTPIGRGKDKVPSPRTCNGDIFRFREIWDAGNKVYRNLENPWREIDVFGGVQGRGEKEKTELDVKWMKVLLNHAMKKEPFIHDVLFAYFNTGLRKSELTFLEWGDLNLDPENPYLIVRRKKEIEWMLNKSIGPKTREYLKGIGGKFSSEEQARDFGKRYKFAIRNVAELMQIGPKNFSNDFLTFQFNRKLTNITKGSKERRVPLNDKMIELFNSQPRREGLVFPGLYSRNISVLFRSFCNDIGRSDVTELHSTRRTFAIICRQNEIPIHTLQEWLGHEDSKMTVQIYAKYQPEVEGKKYRNRISY